MTPTVSGPDGATTPTPGAVAEADGFRPDLEGLRGVAIALVLLFHAGVPWTGGGFVGVDVFFVLSGFLISGLLLRERESTGRIDLLAFYVRRARRILPAALVVIAATLLVAPAFLAPLDLPGVAADAVATALSVGNLRFAAEATDYFARDVVPSPLLHYWSLGVEEQFYLVWPALLILATRLPRPRLGAAAVLAVVTATSLGAAILLTTEAPAWAFYSLPTRAWQLGLGGLVAVGWGRLAAVPGWLAASAGWLGLGSIVVALVAVDAATTPYPGIAALLPAVGAAAVIAGATRRRGPGLVLVVAPLRWLGRISYSLYLIHWPVLVLPAVTLPIGETLPPAERAGLAALSVALAAASWRWIERPIHRGAWGRASGRRVLTAAGGAIAAVAIVAGTFGAVADARLTAALGEPDPSPLASPPSSTPSGTATASPGPSGSPTGPAPSTTPRPSLEPEPSPTATIEPTPTPAGAQPLPADVQPPLRLARDDRPRYIDDGCNILEDETKPELCPYGDPVGTMAIVLLGDSHAGQWFPALDVISQERGWRLYPMTKNNCRFLDLRQYSTTLKREYTECATWRARVVERLATLQPGLVIIANSKGVIPILSADKDWRRQADALKRAMAELPGDIALVVDTPRSIYDVPACLSAHLADTRPCRTPRSRAFLRDQGRAETAAAAETGAALVDVNALVCPGDPCAVVLDRMILYRDHHHLTATFSASLAEALAARLPNAT